MKEAVRGEGGLSHVSRKRVDARTAESSPMFQVGWKVEALKASFPKAPRPGPLPIRIITFLFLNTPCSLNWMQDSSFLP